MIAPIGALVPSYVPPRVLPRQPLDVLAPSTPPSDLINGAALTRLVAGAGSATSLHRFFGTDADRAQAVERLPGGGLKVVFDYPESICKQRVERIMDGAEKPGWSTAWGQMYRPPFGCWTRLEDGWESACVLPSAEGGIEDSMLMLRMTDDGSARMVLWERMRGGGGLMYRLDADAWLREPSRPPAVLELAPYGPQDAPRAPFFEPSPLPSGPPAWDQYFGPAAPTVTVKRRDKDEGCGLEMSFRWGGTRQIYLPLLRSSQAGFVHASYRMDDQIYQRWERTPEGWVGVTDARPQPSGFGTLRRVSLRTELDADGGVRGMVLKVEGRAGDVTEYVLDADAFLAGRARTPQVRDVRRTEAPLPPQVPAPVERGMVEDAGGWIVVDGVRVPKRTTV